MEKERETSWSEEEIGKIKTADERLRKRAIKVAEQLGAQPLAFINQACEDWADTKAAYRFFDNEKVQAKEIISAHRLRVIERMKGHKTVLAIQDSTEFDYTLHPKTRGLGPIGNSKEGVQGILMHTTLAITTEGLPLGILSRKLWTRDSEGRRQENERKSLAIEDKESSKWLDALEESLEDLPEDVEVVAVCDREADIYEFLLSAKNLQTAYLIRAAQDRCLTSKGICLWERLAGCPVVGKMEVEVAAKKNEPKRKATVEMRYCEVKIKPPQRAKDLRMEGWGEIPLTAIWVKEINEPREVTPLEWMLLTNLPVKSIESAFEKIQWYSLRWQIEIYHKVIKSGCQVEKCLLGTYERLKRYLALMSVVAWRLFWLTYIKRQEPELSCTTILAEHEWQALYCKINRTSVLPLTPPTVNQAVRWIAKLGGFLARKGDGEPGITVIWRGWQRLSDISDTWLLLRPSLTCG